MIKILITLFLVVPSLLFAQTTIKRYLSNSPGGKTFNVEVLSSPDNLLKLRSTRDIYRELITIDCKISDSDISKNKISIPYNIVAKSVTSDSLESFGYNSFFYGMYQAYADHRPFVLSPDIIWLLISQGFARHVNANSEILRDHFVNFEGKIHLVVKNDEIDLNNPKSPWEDVFPEFTKEIEKHVGSELIETLSADFSTTGSVEKVVSEITILEAMEPYFEYIVFRMICGIPEITLEGTTADWEKILQKSQALKKYELDWWIDELEPILKQIIETSKGNIDKDFWRNMFKYHTLEKYGAPKVIDGWIVKFFPYDKDGKRFSLKELSDKSNLAEEIVKVDLLHIEESRGKVISTPLELWAGFIGLEQCNKTYALKPKIAWMIRKKAPLNSALIKKFEADNGISDFYGIEIRVTEVPKELFSLKEIFNLELDFVDSVFIPIELSKVKIGKLNIKGKISRDEQKRIVNLFPKTVLSINKQLYENNNADWIEVDRNSLIEKISKRDSVWVLEIHKAGSFNSNELVSFQMPVELKDVKIDNIYIGFELSDKDIKSIKRMYPNSRLFVGFIGEEK
ncbi:MAG: DUF4419 domain-containing protein [Bacteroidales bacterium]|nr:DUF4419 domain-containing protein [Bacteroidales bacterium]